MTQATPARGRFERWWSAFVVGGVDYDAVLRQIAEESGWNGRYAFLIVISAMISLLGLLMPSVAVLIGAMLLSPLMMPIIGLGFGIATFDTREIRRSATALLVGAALAVALSVLCVTLSPIQTITSEIAGRTRPTLFDLLVALLSAVAGAYALIRGRGGAVVGVAIAIALMPPLVVVGFGIATLNWTVFAGSLLLFATNAITIALTAALVARIYGFGSHLSPQHTGWQLMLFFGALSLLSVPLLAGLRQIAFEAVAQRQVRETISARFPDSSRLGQLDVDYTTTPIRIRAVVLTPRVDPAADRLLAAELRQRLHRPIDVHVDQLRVPPNGSGVEAAQIARASSVSRSEDGDRLQQAISVVALVAGVKPADVAVDREGHVLTATASALPGLPVALFRLLEQRAVAAAMGWGVRITPPADATLPVLRLDAGVIDDTALDEAAWVSQRDPRALVVNGGSQAQRLAVAAGVEARGGKGVPGAGGGELRFGWADLKDQ